MNWLFVDYFDTLVVRDCTPDTIKRIWAKEIADRSGGYVKSAQLYKIRIAAEQKVGEKLEGVISTSYNYMQLARDIYKRLLVANPQIQTVYCSCEEFHKIAIDVETQVEVQHQSVDTKTAKKLSEAKEQGRKTAIVSDFHMGKAEYTIFLRTLGISELIDEIFVSADINKRKDSGELYEYVLQVLNVSPEQCEMMGDNKYSDYIIPKKMGIHATQYKENLKKTNSYMTAEQSLVKLYKKNKSKVAVNYGFALYAFVSRLYDELVSNNLPNVFFLAREGEFLKELFDHYTSRFSRKKIESGYLYVSRLATFVPTLGELGKENFENLFRQYKALSPGSFLQSVGLDKNTAEAICKDIGYDRQAVIEDFAYSDCFEKIKENAVFSEKYNEVRNAQKYAFSEYLQRHLKAGQKEISVVDVGWKGTIQDNIFRFYNNEYKVYGYYIGLTDNLKVDENNIKKGINFSSFPYKTNYYDIWGYDKSFYEKLLSASHPATIGYRLSEQGAEPIFDNGDKQESHKMLKNIHQDILDLFMKIDDAIYKNGSTFEELETCFAKLHLRTITNYSYSYMKFQNMLIEDHTQNFGEFSWSQKQLGGKIVSIIKNNLKTVIRKIFKEGLSIKYMYPATKLLQKMHLTIFIPMYTSMVCSYEMTRINKGNHR